MKLVLVQILADIVGNAIPNYILNIGLYSASIGKLSLVTPRSILASRRGGKRTAYLLSSKLYYF